MTATIRFPRELRTPEGAAEASQIIVIQTATNTLAVGGPATYTDVDAWKLAGIADAAPYTDIVIEFSADDAVTIGDGTTRIGLFGEIDPGGDLSLRKRFLLGVLGLNLGNTAFQIPIIEQGTGGFVGFAQVVCNVAAYDRLAVGGIEGDVTTGDVEIVVTARPIRRRDYAG